MIAAKPMSEEELKENLKNNGYSESDKTSTGRFWTNPDKDTIHVPDSIDGFYPDWLLYDIEGL